MWNCIYNVLVILKATKTKMTAMTTATTATTMTTSMTTFKNLNLCLNHKSSKKYMKISIYSCTTFTEKKSFCTNIFPYLFYIPLTHMFKTSSWSHFLSHFIWNFTKKFYITNKKKITNHRYCLSKRRKQIVNTQL
jgi:hypothetical protein